MLSTGIIYFTVTGLTDLSDERAVVPADISCGMSKDTHDHVHTYKYLPPHPHPTPHTHDSHTQTHQDKHKATRSHRHHEKTNTEDACFSKGIITVRSTRTLLTARSDTPQPSVRQWSGRRSSDAHSRLLAATSVAARHHQLVSQASTVRLPTLLRQSPPADTPPRCCCSCCCCCCRRRLPLARPPSPSLSWSSSWSPPPSSLSWQGRRPCQL